MSEPNPHDLVSETMVDGADVKPIVDRIQDSIKDSPRIPSLVALVSVVLLMQFPQITMDQLYSGVEDVSRYVTLWLSGLEAEVDSDLSTMPVPAGQLN